MWPLTVCVIASLLQYFAWQSERLTPEGLRPEALLLTGRGLLKAPLVHLAAWAALSRCRSSSGREREGVGEWEAAALSRAEALQGEAWSAAGSHRHAANPQAACLPAPGQSLALVALSPLQESASTKLCSQM